MYKDQSMQNNICEYLVSIVDKTLFRNKQYATCAVHQSRSSHTAQWISQGKVLPIRVPTSSKKQSERGVNIWGAVGLTDAQTHASLTA